jgi:hypothetical protein
MMIELETPEKLQAAPGLSAKNLAYLALNAKLFATYLVKGEDVVYIKVFAELLKATRSAYVSAYAQLMPFCS